MSDPGEKNGTTESVQETVEKLEQATYGEKGGSTWIEGDAKTVEKAFDNWIKQGNS